MVKIIFTPNFNKHFKKINNKLEKEKIIKQISKIKNNPEMGKPMRYERKKTRETYISPYRLAYALIKNKIYILDIYHKDRQ